MAFLLAWCQAENLNDQKFDGQKNQKEKMDDKKDQHLFLKWIACSFYCLQFSSKWRRDTT